MLLLLAGEEAARLHMPKGALRRASPALATESRWHLDGISSGKALAHETGSEKD
jgi:hypothetical protein